MIEREVCDVYLADLRNQNEAFAGDRKFIGQLDFARENENQIVAGANFVIGRYGTRKKWQELRRRAAEDIHAKHITRRPAGGAHDPRVGTDQRRIDRGHAERLNRRQLLCAGGARCGVRSHVRIEQCRGIAARHEPRANLVSRQPRLGDARAHHIAQPGLLLQRLLDLAHGWLLGAGDRRPEG